MVVQSGSFGQPKCAQVRVRCPEPWHVPRPQAHTLLEGPLKPRGCANHLPGAFSGGRAGEAEGENGQLKGERKMSKTRMKTTATLLTMLFLVSMLSVALVNATSTVQSIEWLPPLTSHEEFGFKDGSTLPIKFRLLDGSGSFVMDDSVEVTVNDILFSDDFEAETVKGPASQWAEVSGAWRIELQDSNKVYGVDRDVSPNVEAITVAGDTSWTDYVLEYKCYITEDGVEREGSAFVRADSDASNGYLIHPQVGGSDPGHVALWKRVSGTYTKLATKYAGITPDEWHTIKVVLQEKNIKVYVGGETMPTIDYTDTIDPILNGRIGLRLADNRHAHFDDVLVLVSEITSFSYAEGTIKNELFSDSFEDANAWTPIAGTWAIEDGVYTQSEYKYIPGCRSVAGDTTWTDYTVLAKVKVIDGSWGRWGGILLRVADPGDVDNAGTYYELYLQALPSWTTGNLQLVKTVSGIRNAITNPHIGKFWDDGFWFIKGTIRTTESGAQILGKAWKEGTSEPDWQIDYTDMSPISSGQIGLITYGQLVHFDDVVVRGFQYLCNLHTKELGMLAGDYMITVSGDGYEFQKPFELVEPGKGKGKP